MATEVEQLKLVLRADLDKFNRDTTNALKNLNTNAKKGSKALKDVEDASASLNRFGGRALLAFAGIAASALSVQKIQEYADSYINVQNRIRTVIDPTQDLAEVTNELLKIANETRNSLESTSILYSRLKRNTEELSLSNEELFDITRLINKSFKVSGATATEASNAIIQLTQGLAVGALRGEEFNAVAEQAPVILEAVAAATGRSKGELRELAADGKISADVLIQSLQAYSKIIDSDFSKANITAEDAVLRLTNNFTVLIGELDKSVGFTEGSVNSLTALSDILENLKQPILDTAEFFKDLAGVIDNNLSGSAEAFSDIAKDFEQELKIIQELFGAFIFAIETGVLVVPALAKAAVELSIAGIVMLVDEARIKILEFRQFLAEKLGQEDVVQVLQTQIDAIGSGAGETFDAVVDRVTNRLGELKTVAADFEKEMADERLERLTEQDEIELEKLRERLEKEKEIREEFEKTGRGSVELDDTVATEKAKTKAVKQEEKVRTDIRRKQSQLASSLIKGLLGDSKGAALAALLVQQGLAAAEVFVSTQAASARALAELGPIAGPPVAAAIETKGTISLAAIAATTLGGASSIGGGGGGIGAAAATPADLTTFALDEREGFASVDVRVAGDEGVASANIEFHGSPGDSLSDLFAEVVNEGIRTGRITTGPGDRG